MPYPSPDIRFNPPRPPARHLVSRSLALILFGGVSFLLVRCDMSSPSDNLYGAAVDLLVARKAPSTHISIRDWLGPDVDGLCIYDGAMGSEDQYLEQSPRSFANAIATIAAANYNSGFFGPGRTYIFVIRHGQPAERNELIFQSGWNADAEPDNQEYDRCYAADEEIRIEGSVYGRSYGSVFFWFPKSPRQPAYQADKTGLACARHSP